MFRWGDGETGRWGDWEMGRLGDGNADFANFEILEYRLEKLK